MSELLISRITGSQSNALTRLLFTAVKQLEVGKYWRVGVRTSTEIVHIADQALTSDMKVEPCCHLFSIWKC